MGYAFPSSARYVSCSWQCHRDRVPCSAQPGTDYAAAYGSQLYAIGNGVISRVKTSTSAGEGRAISINLDDGRLSNSLHLSTTGSAYVGMRVTKGQAIPGAKTGASGYGNDWYYGPHVHQTLWPNQNFIYECNATLDFEKYVGDTEPGKTQRVVGPNGANGRENPNTSGGVTQTLPPGTVADFNGWINGESVEGNKVWFRGAHSGDFFWSGGFTDKGTHDLENLNPVTVNPDQRQAGPNGANGRAEPNTSGPVTGTLAPGAVGTFDGWINGESVEGNKVWFRGKSSGNFYWSGGFTDKGTHDLEDLNDDPDPQPDTTRTTAAQSNIRDLPYTSSPAIGFEDAGVTIPMSGWTHAEEVSGNDVWFLRTDGDWMWSGGFTSQATDGLDEHTTPDPPQPPDPDNPRGLKEYTPVWPLAVLGLEAPLGFKDCKNPVERTTRTTAGSDQHPVTPIIDTYIIHWTDTGTNDAAATDWHSYCNSRSSCPTWQMNRDGKQTEFIRPSAKPAATGPDWNWRSVAVETVGGPDNFTAEQWEQHAQNIALLATFDGKELDGVPVEFKIDREHVLGHREAIPGSTDCPGDAQIENMDVLIARAQVIYDEGNPPVDPCDDCDCPDCPDPTEPVDYDKIAQVVNDEHARRMSNG